MRYGPTETDGVNELLFQLLIRQLAELGHREVALQEEDCRQLLINLELESANSPPSPPEDEVTEPDETVSTPRSPRDWTASSSRTTLLAGAAAGPIPPPVPKWRCFVKSLGSTHILLVLLPASFQDLKLLKLNDDRLLAPVSSSAHVTRVDPDIPPPIDEENEEEEEQNQPQEADNATTSCSLQSMPSRTNSFIAQPSATARLRAGSLDAAPNEVHPQQFHHHSVGSADRRHLRFSHPPPPPPPSSSIGSSFQPIDPSPTSVFASITLPIYLFDCPLMSLVGQLLAKDSVAKEEFCRDHTFRENSAHQEQAPPSTPLLTDSFNTLSHYCTIVESAYCKSLGETLFNSLQLNRPIHSRDVEATLELCRETLLEVDMTQFLNNICGHLKDFRMKTYRQGTDQFPLNLLREHKPCAKLKHLHKLIRMRFHEILCQSFHPVPSLNDYYVYTGHAGQAEEPSHSHREEDTNSLDASSVASSVSTDIGAEIEGDDAIDDEEEIDLDLMEEEEQEQEEETTVPLFLHLTATVRWKKDVASQSLKSLPTCLGDLTLCLSSTDPQIVIDLNELKITLDFLFLTFRFEAVEDGLTVPGPRTGNLRTTSFCSSSSGMLDALSGLALASNNQQMQISQSELSQDDPDADDEEQQEVQDEVDPESSKGSPVHHQHKAAESLARQLQHVPESQRRPVKAALAEIEWMLRDEIVAFLLDSFPITESTLSSVVQHVHSSPHRSSCRRKTVQLHFVLNPAESFRNFLVEFKKFVIIFTSILFRVNHKIKFSVQDFDSRSPIEGGRNFLLFDREGKWNQATIQRFTRATFGFQQPFTTSKDFE